MKLLVDAHEVSVHDIDTFARSVWLCICKTPGMSVDFQKIVLQGVGQLQHKLFRSCGCNAS